MDHHLERYLDRSMDGWMYDGWMDGLLVGLVLLGELDVSVVVLVLVELCSNPFHVLGSNEKMRRVELLQYEAFVGL